jgi:antitoxin (DNA-binding transcriptional repressor) of toxin-antitoxin stability system
MRELETVGIKAFSDQVSSYIRKVSLGIVVYISDRGRIVAELRTPSSPSEPGVDQKESLLLQEMANGGRVRVRSNVTKKFPRGSPLVPAGEVERALSAIREDTK